MFHRSEHTFELINCYNNLIVFTSNYELILLQTKIRNVNAYTQLIYEIKIQHMFNTETSENITRKFNIK